MARPLIRPPKIKHPHRLPPPRCFLRRPHTSGHQSPSQKISLPPTMGHIIFQLKTINLHFLCPLTIGFVFLKSKLIGDSKKRKTKEERHLCKTLRVVLFHFCNRRTVQVVNEENQSVLLNPELSL